MNPQGGLSFTKVRLLFYICSYSKQSHLRSKIDINTIAACYESENYSELRLRFILKSETGNPESGSFVWPL